MQRESGTPPASRRAAGSGNLGRGTPYGVGTPPRGARRAATSLGDPVADFELPDQDGVPRRLQDLLADGPVVLFFYPAAMTYGCTKESCHFRDLKTEFGEVGAQRVGISADDVEKQLAFSDKHSFDYPLLSDPDRKVAQQFGVTRRLSMLP